MADDIKEAESNGDRELITRNEFAERGLDNIAEIANHPLIKFLLNRHGYSILVKILSRSRPAQHQKAKWFIDELSKGGDSLTRELVSSEDFLLSFERVLDASRRARTERKARYFARLLVNASAPCHDESQTPEDLDSYCFILECMTDHQITALKALVVAGHFQRKSSMLDGYYGDLPDELDASIAECENLITSLQSLGLISDVDIDSSEEGNWEEDLWGRGHFPTPRAKRIVAMLDRLAPPAHGGE